MGLILNIETATEVCSIAISEREQMLAEVNSESAYQHASMITTLIDQCFKKANRALKDIDAVAVSTGPGSYTALRVGTSTAKGICFALGKPLIAISTLKAMANASIPQKKTASKVLLCPMIDARRMEVYTSTFDTQLKEVQATHSLIIEANSFENFFKEGYEIIFSGNGASKIKNILTTENYTITNTINFASYLAPLAYKAYLNEKFEHLVSYSPNYFKRPHITTPKKIL